jgi:CheY-like chemotaxis protein
MRDARPTGIYRYVGEGRGELPPPRTMTTMSEDTTGRTAIIADRHALGRNLVRFLLEEEGFEISAEAATIAEVLLAIQHQTPDVLVVHENLTTDHDPAVFAQIRQLSPNTNLVLMTGNRDGLAVELIFVADAVVEEGPGLGQLAFAAGWQAPTESLRADAERARARGMARRRWRPPWGERLDTRGAVAASIVVIAVMLFRAAGFVPFPGSGGPGSPAPSIRAEGPGVGATTSAPIAFKLASSTSPAPEDRSDRPAHRGAPSPDPGQGPAPDPGGEPGPDPTEEPPAGQNEQPPTDPPTSEASDQDEPTVIDEVTAPAEEVVDDVAGTIDDAVDQVEVVVENVETAVDDVDAAVDDVVEDVEAAVDDVDAAVDDVAEGVDDVVGNVVGGLSTPALG